MCMIIETNKTIPVHNILPENCEQVFGYKSFRFSFNSTGKLVLFGYIQDVSYDLEYHKNFIKISSSLSDQEVMFGCNLKNSTTGKINIEHKCSTIQLLGMHFQIFTDPWNFPNTLCTTKNPYLRLPVFTFVNNIQLVGSDEDVIATQIYLPAPKYLRDYLRSAASKSLKRTDINANMNNYIVIYNLLLEKGIK